MIDCKLFEKYNQPVVKSSGPPHALAASVSEIIKVVGDHPKYGYGYWLRIVKKSKRGYGDILGLLKEIEKMDMKYPKGATLTNKLLNKGNVQLRK